MKTNSMKRSPSSVFNVESAKSRFPIGVRCARFTLDPATPRAAPGFLLSVFCFLLFVGSASAATRYVWQDSPNPGPPYDTWANAAHDIQTAVDVAAAGDEIVVTNGVYAFGGRAVGANVLVNRVVVDKPLTVRSVNGPGLTVIQGDPYDPYNWQTIRCVYLAGGASLSGFTLTDGYAYDGGGVYCETATAVVSNCVLTGNSAYPGFGGGYGGGASDCTLYNCTLTGNLAYGDLWIFGGGGGGALNCILYNCYLSNNSVVYGDGGGAAACTLYNCTLAGNSAEWGGGGAYGCTLNNCIVYFNTTGGDYSGGTLNYCCTTAMPAGGIGNITDAPLFVNTNNWSDLRLRADSPCIDAGTNLAGLISTDILGLPRPLDGNGDGIARFDIGAYEFNPYRFTPTLHLGANGFQFTVCGEPGRSVRIELSRNLVNWEYAGEVPIPACGQTLIDPAATIEPRLFYRARRVP